MHNGELLALLLNPRDGIFGGEEDCKSHRIIQAGRNPSTPSVKPPEVVQF